MEVTRRYWKICSLIIVLALWALFLQEFLLLAGVVFAVAWLLARQYQFVHRTQHLIDELVVNQQLDRTRVTAGETTVGTLSVTAQPEHGVSLSVRSATPPGSDAADTTCSLTDYEDNAESTFKITWPVAGEFRFDQPTVTISDSLSLFSQSTTLGPTPTVIVEPRAPREIHVGEGGDRVAAGLGKHDTEESGNGLTPAELRKYVSGDSIRQIDWKATARLDETYVREFEAETDVQTQLIVDHRSTMGRGHSGETKLDYGRQVALAIVENAQRFGDPLGWYSVSDNGFTDTIPPSTENTTYETIIHRLRTLTASKDVSTPPQPAQLSPAAATHTAERLREENMFNRSLRPFFEGTNTYVQLVAEDPLFEAVRRSSTRQDGFVRTIIVTDDQYKTELREAVKVARRGDGEVLVFLTPDVLYGQQNLTNIEAAYNEYTTFESFRRDIASLSAVRAFEVGPRDQLLRIMPTNRRSSEQ